MCYPCKAEIPSVVMPRGETVADRAPDRPCVICRAEKYGDEDLCPTCEARKAHDVYPSMMDGPGRFPCYAMLLVCIAFPLLLVLSVLTGGGA